MKKLKMAILTLCCVFLLCGCGSVNNLMESIQANNSDEARRIYSEEIASDTNKIKEMEAAIQKYLNQQYTLLNEGKILPDDIWATVNTVHALPFAYNSDTEYLLSHVLSLADSKERYTEALQALNDQDFHRAYQLLEAVIPEDSNYEIAATRRAEVLNSSMEAVSQLVEQNISENKFQDALGLVDDEISQWGSNSFLDNLRKTLLEKWEVSCIAEASELCQEGQYSEAIGKLRDYYWASGNDNPSKAYLNTAQEIVNKWEASYIAEASELCQEGHYSEAIDKLQDYCLESGNDDPSEAYLNTAQEIVSKWELAVKAEAAAAFGTDKDYGAAIQVLQRSGLNTDAITEEIERYNLYTPVSLTDMEPIEQGRYLRIGRWGFDGRDVNGNEYPMEKNLYPQGTSSWDYSANTSFVTYYLGAEYTTFRAKLFRPYCSLSASEEDCVCEPSVKIYGDGALLYTSPRISLDTYEDFDIQIDVTGVRKLKIEIMGMYAQGIDFGLTLYDPLVCMTNAVIQR